MRFQDILRCVLLLPIVWLSGCIVPPREDVHRAAEIFLRRHFQRDFTVLKVKSTVNEGNMNFKGFEIVAAPTASPRALFSFNADYRDNQIVPHGKFIDRQYAAALERVEHSTRLVAALRPHFQDFMAVFNPSIWNDAVMEIYFFHLPTEADKHECFQKIAEALRAFRPYPKAEKITLRVAFFPRAFEEMPADRLADKYFTFKTGDAAWKIRYAYGVEMALNPEALPDAGELETKLAVNSVATLIQTARWESKREVEKLLRQEFPETRYVVGSDGIRADFAGALHRLRFRFKACPKGQSMRKCPDPLRMAAVYDLNRKTVEIRRVP